MLQVTINLNEINVSNVNSDSKLSDRLICQAEIHNRQKLNPAYLIKYKMGKKIGLAGILGRNM